MVDPQKDFVDVNEIDILIRVIRKINLHNSHLTFFCSTILDFYYQLYFLHGMEPASFPPLPFIKPS